jgi:hypothetical protein
MRRSKLSVLFLAVSALPAGAQVIATSARWPGIQVYFDAKIEPPPGPGADQAVVRQLERAIVGGVIVDGQVHRFWRDAEQKVYLGYDLSIEPGPNPRILQVHILPLSLTPRQMAEQGFPETWTRLSLPKYPVIPEVRVGDTLAIDLMANPKTGQKVVDYLTIQHTGPPAAGRARDFTLADAGLSVNRPRLNVNGKLVDATAHTTGGISGATVWFYLQGQGRFVLSLVPKPEFKLNRAGEVSDNVLTFRDGADTFRMECDGRIAPSPGRYNIYVFHDRDWRPTERDAGAPFILGSAPLEALIRNR